MTLLSGALPLLLLAFAALAAYLGPLVVRYVKDRRIALVFTLLGEAALRVAGAIAQTVVADLKDPSKPGEWGPDAARAAKQAAVLEVKALYPEVVSGLRSLGRDDAAIDAAIRHAVEAAVHELKARSPADK